MLFLLLELSESIAPLVLLVRWHEPYPHTTPNRTEPNRTVAPKPWTEPNRATGVSLHP